MAERIAKVIGIGRWAGNRSPRFNKSGDKALIDFEYDAGADWLVYTATFHKTDGLWRLRGVRETLQKFAAPHLIFRPPAIDLPPPPELLSSPPAVPPKLDDFWPPMPVLNQPKDISVNPRKK